MVSLVNMSRWSTFVLSKHIFLRHIEDLKSKLNIMKLMKSLLHSNSPNIMIHTVDGSEIWRSEPGMYKTRRKHQEKTTWSGADRWPYVFLDFGYFVPRFTMFLCFFLPNLFETPFFVSLEQSQNKSDKRCRISAGLFPRNTWVRQSMHRSIPLRSTLNTGYITGLDMCKLCTEAVCCVALWTRVTSQVWTCVRYVPKQSIA